MGSAFSSLLDCAENAFHVLHNNAVDHFADQWAESRHRVLVAQGGVEAGAAILFGYTQGMQNALLLAGVTTVPRQFVSMIPYVVTIIAVSGLVGRVRAPAAEGKVYDTEGGSE